jgi:hypothetical protein
MKAEFKWLSCLVLLMPILSQAQIVSTDSLPTTDSASIVHKDTLVVITDTVIAVKKTCYAEWHDAFRTRGAKVVPDGMQDIVIAIKDADNCRCFMGRVEVVAGKIKPPLYFQQEDGEYKLVSIVGKKLEPAFASAMSSDELYSIKDGMSIVFRTTDQEYGRLFFYKFANKSAQSNKEALSPSELIKD